MSGPKPRKSARTAFARLGMIAFLAAALGAAALSLPGCMLFDFFAQPFEDRSIKAVFTLTDQPTVILVDDPAGLLPTTDLKNLIASRVEFLLKDNKALKEIVPYGNVEQLRAAEADFDKWPMDKVGQRLSARQVIYIMVEQFALLQPGDVYRPTANVQVKVVDSITGQRLFPPTADMRGYPVAVRQSFKAGQESTRGAENLLARRLAEVIAKDSAELFYNHTPREPGSGFDD